VKSGSAIAVLVAMVLVVAGCSDSKDGNPSPVTGSGSLGANTSSSVPANGVPKVSKPVAADKFLKDPCSLMTSSQATEVAGFTSAKADLQGVTGPECTWQDVARNNISIGFIVAGGGGLAGVYQNKDQAAYFEPTNVDDYPGVFNDSLDERAKGSCALNVGVRDDLVLSVISRYQSSSANYATSCASVKKAAEYAVATMKAGS